MSDGTRVTMLNSLADRDFEKSLDQQKEWGVELVDLKDSIFGKRVMELTDEEAERAAEMIQERDMEVYCLSTGLFFADVEGGEQEFRQRHLGRVQRAVELAGMLQPRFIRLLAASTRRRSELRDAVAYVRREFPWLFEVYQEGIDRISEAGFEATVENEVGGCILSTPDDTLRFVNAIDPEAKAWLTWDVANMWQMGAFPSAELYEQLRPVIGYVHLKGGMAEGDGQSLRWRSALEDADWPVAEVVRDVVSDGVSPVLCLNYPHGEDKPGYDYEGLIKRDLDYVRRLVRGAE